MIIESIIEYVGNFHFKTLCFIELHVPCVCPLFKVLEIFLLLHLIRLYIDVLYMRQSSAKYTVSGRSFINRGKARDLGLWHSRVHTTQWRMSTCWLLLVNKDESNFLIFISKSIWSHFVQKFLMRKSVESMTKIKYYKIDLFFPFKWYHWVVPSNDEWTIIWRATTKTVLQRCLDVVRVEVTLNMATKLKKFATDICQTDRSVVCSNMLPFFNTVFQKIWTKLKSTLITIYFFFPPQKQENVPPSIYASCGRVEWLIIWPN